MRTKVRRSCTIGEDTDALSPEQRAKRQGAAQGALLGAVLAVVSFAGTDVLLAGAGTSLAAVAGATATGIAALAAGIWAGVPAADDTGGAAERLAPRWIAAGVAVGAAGMFALFSAVLGARLGALGKVLGPLLLLAAPAYTVGLAFPSLVTWIEEFYDDGSGESALDAAFPILVGALAGFAIGTVLAGMVLLPMLAPGPLLLAVGAALTSSLLWPRSEPPRSTHNLVWQEETPFGTLHVVDTIFPGGRQPERRLYLNDEVESGELTRGGAPTLAYVAAAERWLAQITPRGSRYLFLGGGAYTLPRRVAERDPSAQITVGELDPEVTRVAERFFGLRPEHRIRVLHGDARALLDAAETAGYDRIYVDVYDGREAIPYALLTREAWGAAGRALRPGGVAAMNLIGVATGAGARRFWSAVHSAAEALPSVVLYHHLGRDFPDPQNFLLAASPEPGFEFPAHAGGFERWDRDTWPASRGTTVFRDRFGERAGVAG